MLLRGTTINLLKRILSGWPAVLNCSFYVAKSSFQLITPLTRLGLEMETVLAVPVRQYHWSSLVGSSRELVREDDFACKS